MDGLFVPARKVGFDPDAQWVAEAFWTGASGANWTAGQRGQTGLPFTFREWSFPRWNAEGLGPKDRIRIWPAPAMFGDTGRFETVTEFTRRTGPVTLPWGKNWKVGEGTDRGAVIVLEDGTHVTCRNLRRSDLGNRIHLGLTLLSQGRAHQLADISEWDWICDGLAFNTPDNAGRIVDSGCGRLPKHVGQLTADMLTVGVDQALSLVVANSMFGPGAVHRGPGTRVEHVTVASRGKSAAARKMPAGYDKRMIPCGSRLAVTRTHADIVDWVATKPKAQQRAALTLATGLHEFGLIQKETGDGSAQIECEGTLNPETRDKFAALGLTTAQHFSRLLDGLIRGPQDLAVVKES